jgi:hypothetical protein
MTRKSPGGNGRLPKRTLDWAIKSIREHGENDLFARPFEFDVFDKNWNQLAEELTEYRVDHFRWQPARLMVLPKDRVSFRRASQLDAVDSLLLTAVVKLLGQKIEGRRLPRDRVFSNRFAKTGTSLYDGRGWEDFWKKSSQLVASARFVARSDITDFYGQVWHKEILSELRGCGAPDRIIRAVENFLASFNRQGRGLPIGPHAVHLLAELSIARADRLLDARGIKFIRYIDDYHIFCDSEEKAQLALMDLADVLLSDDFACSLNRLKTSITPADEFREEAGKRSREGKIDQRERKILEAIESMTESEYDFAELSEAEEEVASALTDEMVSGLIQSYLDTDPIDYLRLAWLLRRLSQVGAPGAVDLIIENFNACKASAEFS